MLRGDLVDLRPIRERHAGHGFFTEAVQLLVDYLFASRPWRA